MITTTMSTGNKQAYGVATLFPNLLGLLVKNVATQMQFQENI